MPIFYMPIFWQKSQLFNQYLADTDIADIHLADNGYRYRYADTDIQFADTDIYESVSAKYIDKPIYWSNPTVHAQQTA